MGTVRLRHALRADLPSIAGLVSPNPRKLPFYERLGVRVDAEVATPGGSAVMWPMHRRPAVTR